MIRKNEMPRMKRCQQHSNGSIRMWKEYSDRLVCTYTRKHIDWYNDDSSNPLLFDTDASGTNERN